MGIESLARARSESLERFESDATSLRADLSDVPGRWAHTFRPADWTTFDGSSAQLFGPAWTGSALGSLSGEVEAAAACLRRENEPIQMDAAQAPAAPPQPWVPAPAPM
jgi:hypothetical protein